MLIVGDAGAVALGFAAAVVFGGYADQAGWRKGAIVVVAAAVVGVFAIRSQGLLLARISAVRVVEITRITRAIAMTGLGMVLFDRVTHFGLHLRFIAIGAAASLLCLIISRSSYRAWVAARRQRDLNCRQVVAIGADGETDRLIELFATHPELGIRIAGLIGSREQAYHYGTSALWIGDLDDAESLVAAAGASGVVVSSNGISTLRLNQLIRNLQQAGVHVHVATGISGIDARRLRSQPLAYEPLLYVEALTLSKLQLIIKRAFDIAVASFAVLLASPLLLAVAIAIKLDDRGPVFFQQRRVGHNGSHFKVYKFRTMRVDAEQQLAKLQVVNERNGPLFKMANDPRVTRVGKLLRDTSLDELPQLFNVIFGQMSLVGPRPALPAEVATFSPELRAREQVMPGITGLWQVEARDNPSFEAYRRLDLFYVENWSVTLDLIIILGTFEQVTSKLLSALFSRSSDRVLDVAPATAAELLIASESLAS